MASLLWSAGARGWALGGAFPSWTRPMCWGQGPAGCAGPFSSPDGGMSSEGRNLGRGQAGPASGRDWTDAQTEGTPLSFFTLIWMIHPCVIFLYLLTQQGGPSSGCECGISPTVKQLPPGWTRARGKAFVLGLAPALGGGQGPRPRSAGLELTPWLGFRLWTGRTLPQRRDGPISYPPWVVEAVLIFPGPRKLVHWEWAADRAPPAL